ncbi:MAG: Folate transporter FolT [Candidatus Izimaplasma bacterium HR2]|nr:MAG: Folate transporter FolT [Candidatus Izimaplasma bacterium HR2]
MENGSSFFTTRTLNRAAMLIAMSVVLKAFLSIEGGFFRFTLFSIPLILLGILLGPYIGIIAGFIVDWIYVLISPFAFTFNLMTLSTIAWALIPALFFFKKRDLSLVQISAVVVVTSLIAFSLNTYQLYIWAGSGALANVPLRLGIMMLTWGIQIPVVHVIYQRVIVHEFKLIKIR